MEERELTLEDLFYDYESAKDENGRIDPSILTGTYKEYTNEITPAVLTPLPRGFFFSYQEQPARYILQHGKDYIFGILDPGTGKTFVGILISELLRGYYDPSLPRDQAIESLPPVVRQYIAPMRTNFKRCVYMTANHILDREVNPAVAKVKNVASVTIADQKWYIARTFGGFLTKYTANYNREKTRALATMDEDKAEEQALAHMAIEFEQEMSDTFFVLDEVHKLSGENMNKLIAGNNTNYKLIRLMLKSVKRSKAIVFTATPMNNTTTEIIPILNLMLPYDEEIPLSTDLDNMNEKDIKVLLTEKMGDKVFYVTSRPTGMEPVYTGIHLPNTPFSYEPLPMVGQQQEQYIQAARGALNDIRIVSRSEADEDGEEDDKEERAGSSYLLETMTALCWSPIGYSVSAKGEKLRQKKAIQPIIYSKDSKVVKQIAADIEAKTRGAMKERAARAGQEGEATRREREKYEGNVRLIVDAEPYIFDKERMLKDYKEKPENWMIDGPKDNNLRHRSSKYYEILSEMRRDSNKVSLVIFRYRINGGLESFVAIALLNGYERYDDTLTEVVVGEKIVGLEKKKRLIVLTPGMKPATKNLWLKIVGHPDNANGEYINMVIISPGMKIGISVYSVQRIFHTSPDWSPWGELQSLFRGLREGGAEAVLKRRGEWPHGVMKVLITLQCATLTKKEARGDISRPFTKQLKDVGKTRLTTLDEDMYVWLADKYKKHLRVLGPLRNMSVGCNLNVARNGDAVKCIAPVEGELVVDSFNTLYSRRYVWALKQYVRRVMGSMREPLHYADLVGRTRAYNLPLTFYDRAISEIVQEKEPIMSETGYPMYLAYDSDRLYLQSDYPSSSDSFLADQDYLLSYYTNFTVIQHVETQKEAVFALTDEMKRVIVGYKEEEALRDYIKDKYKTVDAQMVILERALVETLRGGKEWEVLLRVYYVYWRIFDTPYKGARIAHSFVSFRHEAGYPIVARLQRPSRYRYYVESTGEWATTLERSALVDQFRLAYSDDKVKELFDGYSVPMAIDTVCDGQFRLVLSRREETIRGKMIHAFTILELAYVAVLLDWVPDESGHEEDRYSVEDIEPELREEIEATYGERAPVMEEVTVDIANDVYEHYTREQFISTIRAVFEQQKRVIRA
jgi:hypothetical protein